MEEMSLQLQQKVQNALQKNIFLKKNKIDFSYNRSCAFLHTHSNGSHWNAKTAAWKMELWRLVSI